MGTRRSRISKLVPRYPSILIDVLSDCKSILDVGCGYDSPLGHLSPTVATFRVGFDVFLPALLRAKSNGTHENYVQFDISYLSSLPEKTFDAVVALDVIEHLSKRKGRTLIKNMEKLARKRIVIVTPNGYLPQNPLYGNEFQKHLSGWTMKELTSLMFRVIGINGLRPLRKEFAKIRYPLPPRQIWTLVSEISNVFCKNHPRWAFALLCIKDL